MQDAGRGEDASVPERASDSNRGLDGVGMDGAGVNGHESNSTKSYAPSEAELEVHVSFVEQAKKVVLDKVFEW